MISLGVAISFAVIVAVLSETWRRRATATMLQAMTMGAVWAVALAFPLAALCALVYRFPIPLVGFRSGPEAMRGAIFSVMFAGALGGFPALLAGGAAAGALARRVGRPDRPRRVQLLVPVLAGLVAAVGVGALAFFG